MQCLYSSKRDIHKHNVFLALDNVSNNIKSIDQAKAYLNARYEYKSIIMVTTRSLYTLKCLNIDENACLKMSKLEANEVESLFMHHAALDIQL